MCIGGQDTYRNDFVFITIIEGDRMALLAVSVYTYIGINFQSNIKYTQFIKKSNKLYNNAHV